LVVEGDGGQRFGDGKDDMEVLDGQQLGGTLLEPAGASQALALGAVPVAAGTVENVGVSAVVAPFDGTAQHGSTAGLDGGHQSMLMERQRMRLPVSRAVLSKDIGHLQVRRHEEAA
jgi:hypothetical protein